MSRGNQGHKSGSASISHEQFQFAVAGFLNLRLAPPDFFSAFPAGTNLGRRVGAKLKRLGMKRGMPDIFPIAINGSQYGIELKVGKDRLSSYQIETHKLLIASGTVKEIAECRPSVDNNLEHLRGILDIWGAKLRTVSPSAERLQMSIDAWSRSHEKSSETLNFPVDSFPISDQIGSRKRKVPLFLKELDVKAWICSFCRRLVSSHYVRCPHCNTPQQKDFARHSAFKSSAVGE